MDDSKRAFGIFLLGVCATIAAVGGGIVFAVHHSDASAAAARQESINRMIGRGMAVIVPTEAPVGASDPFDARWDDVPALRVALKPQNMASPSIDQVSVPEITIAAMCDGEHVTFRLNWPDAERDMNVDSGRFTDAVALQFALARYASFMMGGKDMPVQILHWKALWQKDVDERFQDVQDVHPNYWADLYWFATPVPGSNPNSYRVPDSFEDESSRQWFPAHQARNPMSRFDRQQPVEELIAEGFGTLTQQTRSATRGRGVWRDGRWYVVFTRPMLTDDPEDFQFHDGASGELAIAVWQGSAGDVGGRKQYADWITFKVTP